MRDLEYNFTRELKQPHKLYHIGKWAIPFAKDGLSLQYVVLIGILGVTVLAVTLLAFVFDIKVLKSAITNGWLLIILGIGIFVWVFFSIKWDNKSFLSFLFGRILNRRVRKHSVEQGHIVPIQEQKLRYEPVKRGKRIG